jgi:hypothetical protein
MIIQLTREEKLKLANKMCRGYVHIPTRYLKCDPCNIRMMLFENDTTEDTELHPAKRCHRCNSRNLRVEII